MPDFNGYIRCSYIDDETRVQCSAWFKFIGDSPKGQFCPIHTGSTSVSSVAAGSVTEEREKSYYDLVSAEKDICARMTDEQLDLHIQHIQDVIAGEKAKLLSARATRATRLENLSDEERRERIKKNQSKQAFEPKKEEKKDSKVGKLIKTLALITFGSDTDPVAIEKATKMFLELKQTG